MQNYNNPSQPQGGYGPQPPPKKGMSTGVKVLIVAVVLVVVFGSVLILLGVGGYFYFRRQAQQIVSDSTSTTRSGLSGSSSSSSSSDSSGEAEAPEPTAAQSAAIAGGQSATWAQQEITWTVPQRWTKFSSESTSFMWRSPGSGDAAALIVSVSPMSSDFPADSSVNAFYAAAEQRKRTGEVDDVRWLKLDGVRGVMFREAAPENSDSPQRLQWMGYRNYKGQLQLVNIMLASEGKYFARHEDAMYGILYSTKLSQ